MIDQPCVVLSVRPKTKSYYVRDIETERVYFRNRKFLRPSESAKQDDFEAKNMELVVDSNTQIRLDTCAQEETAWNVVTNTTDSPPTSCVKSGPADRNKHVHYDASIFAMKAEFRRSKKN